jgi:uncharacterized protein YbaR (Trm112 family)
MCAVIHPDLLAILACPRCDERPALRLDGEHLTCDQCHASYPIVNGVPHLLPESAVFPDSPATPQP